VLHVLTATGAEVVEDHDIVAAMGYPICKVGADEAGAPGDQL